MLLLLSCLSGKDSRSSRSKRRPDTSESDHEDNDGEPNDSEHQHSRKKVQGNIDSIINSYIIVHGIVISLLSTA